MLCLSMPTAIAHPVTQEIGNAALEACSGNLDPVGRATLLGTLPPFSQISREEMLAFSAIATERKAAAGAQILAEMDPPALQVVVSGSISMETPEGGAAMSAKPGDAVGLYQMLAGIPLVRRAHCIEDSLLLSVDREEFLDLLTQRPEFLRQVLGRLFFGGGGFPA
jgi:CRP-like cAMP-binding protein